MTQGLYHNLPDGFFYRDFIKVYLRPLPQGLHQSLPDGPCPRDFITVYLMTSDQGTPSRTVYLTASVIGTSKIICYLTAFVPGTSSQLTAFVPTCTIICLPDGLCPRDFITMFNSAKERTPSSSTVQRLYVICTCSNISS